MAHRHKAHKAKGGKLPYNAQGSNVEKEAEEKAAGGAVAKKHGGTVHGEKAHGRLDRKHRKRGGRVGANHHPFSSAKIHEKGNETAKARPKTHHAN